MAVCCFAFPAFTGCGEGSQTVAESHDHDHDHDHAHGEGGLPAHGPNNGHLFKLEGTDLIAEWIHYSDNDIIRVLLLDKGLENAVEYDGVMITPTAGDDKTPFVLELDPEKNINDKKLVYMLDEKKLMLAMSLGVDVEIKVGDKTYKGKIAPHAPHDH
jgi:hypothetical protein